MVTQDFWCLLQQVKWGLLPQPKANRIISPLVLGQSTYTLVVLLQFCSIIRLVGWEIELQLFPPSRPVPPENRGRDFWQFLWKWRFLAISMKMAIFCILAIFCNFLQFFMFFVQFFAIFNVFVPRIFEIDCFFLIYKKKF